MREGLMMDDYPLSLTALVERAERFSASQAGRLQAARRLSRSHDDRRLCASARDGLARRLETLGIERRRPGRDAALEPARASRAVLRAALDGRA